MMHSNTMRAVIVSICVILATIDALELDCEQKSYQTRHYFPKVITLSRLGAGNYTINLKCQGKTLDGVPIQNDLIEIEHDVVNSTLTGDSTTDEHFARYVSMTCGSACFNPVISEYDLLAGRVCLPREDKLKRACRETSISVTEGLGSQDEDNSNIWRAIAIILIVFLIVFAILAMCKFFLAKQEQRAKKENQAKQNSDHNATTAGNNVAVVIDSNAESQKTSTADQGDAM